MGGSIVAHSLPLRQVRSLAQAGSADGARHISHHKPTIGPLSSGLGYNVAGLLIAAPNFARVKRLQVHHGKNSVHRVHLGVVGPAIHVQNQPGNTHQRVDAGR